MSRILQIRRGTATEHENFTGMIGEITMDTTNNTLRLHDGKTLGGFPLARSGDSTSTNTESFDITTVPDEFWADIVTRFTPTSPRINVYDSSLLRTNSAVTASEYVFNNISTDPINVKVLLVCQTPDAGYQIGDYVAAFGIGDRTNPAPNTVVTPDGLSVKLMVAKQNYWVSHKSTGEKTTITPDNWRFIFRVYC